MKKKSSRKKATPSQRPEKKKPVARRVTKSASKPAAVKGEQVTRGKKSKRKRANTAQPGAKSGSRKTDVFRRPRPLKDLGGLFMLYEMGDGKIWASMSDKLNDVFLLTMRGHSHERGSATLRLERGLTLLAEIYRWGKMASAEATEMSKLAIGNVALSDLAESLGGLIVRIMEAREKSQAESLMLDALAAFKKALAGLVKETGLTNGFHTGARSTGKFFPPELVAIRFARCFCETNMRLPSKLELRNMLENVGVRYTADRNQSVKWRGLFARAELDSLPDTHSVI